jgi:hypothetical protein
MRSLSGSSSGEGNGLMGEIGDRLAIDCHHLVLDRHSRHPGTREQFVAEAGSRRQRRNRAGAAVRLEPPAGSATGGTLY